MSKDGLTLTRSSYEKIAGPRSAPKGRESLDRVAIEARITPIVSRGTDVTDFMRMYAIGGDAKNPRVSVIAPKGGEHVTCLMWVVLAVSTLMKRGETMKEAADQLTEAANDVLGATTKLVNAMRPLASELDSALSEVRGRRMAIVSEVRQMRTELSDLRKFFLSDDHAEEVARLEHFAGVCERITALKNSGHLDTLVDTLVKLT